MAESDYILPIHFPKTWSYGGTGHPAGILTVKPRMLTVENEGSRLSERNSNPLFRLTFNGVAYQVFHLNVFPSDKGVPAGVFWQSRSGDWHLDKGAVDLHRAGDGKQLTESGWRQFSPMLKSWLDDTFSDDLLLKVIAQMHEAVVIEAREDRMGVLAAYLDVLEERRSEALSQLQAGLRGEDITGRPDPRSISFYEAKNAYEAAKRARLQAEARQAEAKASAK